MNRFEIDENKVLSNTSSSGEDFYDDLKGEIEPTDEELKEIEEEINEVRKARWRINVLKLNDKGHHYSSVDVSQDGDVRDFVSSIANSINDPYSTLDSLKFTTVPSSPEETKSIEEIHENPIRDKVSLLSEPVADYFYDEIFSGEIKEKGLYYNSEMKKFTDKAKCLQSEWKESAVIFWDELRKAYGSDNFERLKLAVKREYPDEKALDVLKREYVCVSEYRAADGSNTAIFEIGEFDVRDVYKDYHVKIK